MQHVQHPRIPSPAALSRIALAEARKGKTFRAVRLIENADWRTGEPAKYEDITAEVLAMKRKPDLRMTTVNGGKMTAGTRNGLKVRLTRETDEARALAYMRAMTGKEFNMVIWGVCANGLKRVQFVAMKARSESQWDRKRRRYVTVETSPEEVTEIPHWDWNGHNAKIEDCEINS